MKLSDGVEWGLHCGVLLGFLAPDAVAADRPAGRVPRGARRAYLAKHLQAMSRAGLLESVQGPHGGYRLARPPTEITRARRGRGDRRHRARVPFPRHRVHHERRVRGVAFGSYGLKTAISRP